MSNSVLSQVLAMASKPYNEIEIVENLITPNYGLNLLQRLIKLEEKKVSYLFNGQFFCGSTRDVTDGFCILVKSEFNDFLQGELL